MNLYEFLTVAALLAAIIFLQYRHEKQVKDMCDRLMAKDLQEYEYYAKKYDKDIDHLQDVRKRAVAEPAEAPRADSEKKVNLAGFQEDWGSEEEDELAVSKAVPAVKE